MCVVWFMLTSHGPDRPGVARTEPASVESAVPEASPDDRVSVEAAAPHQSVRTVRDYLMEFYGPDWVNKEAIFESRQKALLDKPLTEVAEIRPWEEVEAQLMSETLLTPKRIESRADAALDWDPNTDLSWESIGKVFPNVPPNMGQRQLLEFQTIVREHNEPIKERALQQNALLADALAYRWATKQYARGPYSLPANQPEPGRRAAMSMSTASKTGWCVSCYVYYDELPPEYGETDRQIQQMVEARTAALHTYLAGFK